MAWLNKHLKHSDREKIEAALRTADLRTSGEIIPVVARRSARYGHVSWLAAALCLAAAEGAAGAGWLPLFHGYGSLQAAATALLCVVLGGLLARIAFVRRLLTPRADRVYSVHRSAEAAFHRLALHRSRGDAGVLLFVSMEERQAVVLAGAGIHDLAGAPHWLETCKLLTDSGAQRDLGGGFERAIAHAAGVLALHHPAIVGEARPVMGQRLKILHEAP